MSSLPSVTLSLGLLVTPVPAEDHGALLAPLLAGALLCSRVRNKSSGKPPDRRIAYIRFFQTFHLA